MEEGERLAEDPVEFEVICGEGRIQATDDLLHACRVGRAVAVQHDFRDADPRNALVVAKLSPFEAEQGVEDRVACGGLGGGWLGHYYGDAGLSVGLSGAGALVRALGTDAGDCEEGFEGTGRIGFFQRTILPLRERLMLEHGAGGPADITVGAVQVRPSEGDGLGVLDAVEGFELLAEFGFVGRAREHIDPRGAFLADITHAVEAGLHLAAADGEIHRAIFRVDEGVGDGQGATGHEFFLGGGVASAFRCEVDRVDFAPAPVEGVKGLLVLGWELSAVAEGHARR